MGLAAHRWSPPLNKQHQPRCGAVACVGLIIDPSEHSPFLNPFPNCLHTRSRYGWGYIAWGAAPSMWQPTPHPEAARLACSHSQGPSYLYSQTQTCKPYPQSGMQSMHLLPPQILTAACCAPISSPSLNSWVRWSPVFISISNVSTRFFHHSSPCLLSFSGPAALRLMPMRHVSTLPMPDLLLTRGLAVQGCRAAGAAPGSGHV